MTEQKYMRGAMTRSLLYTQVCDCHTFHKCS